MSTKQNTEKKLSKKKKITVGSVMTLIILTLLAIFFIFPFYWIITGAFKLQDVAVALPPEWFPTNPTLDNWVKLFKNPAGSWFLNSVYLSFFTMILVCVTSTLAGYVLGKKNFYGSKLMFAIFIGAMALPKQVILIPLVRIVSAWEFGDTLSAVILPAVGWPFGIFLMKQFSQTVPNELLESAKIDGCSEWGIFTKIVLPLVKPGVAALAIFTFISSWNDYFLQLIFLNSRSNLSLPLGVATMQQEFSSNYGVIMAGAALASLPMVIIFVFFQKYFTQGITMGAVKG